MNKTIVTEFILLGLESDPRRVLDLTLLLTYTVILTGNILVIILVFSQVQLQMPMYFFLSNLSLLEISFSSAVIPQMLHNSFLHIKSISKSCCILQSFRYFLFGTTELTLLACMSFDRYVAICQPLRYSSIVSHKICFNLCFGCWIWSFIFLFFPLFHLIQLPFCGPNVINHFFCDSTLLIKLSCSVVLPIKLWSIVAFNVVILGSLIFTVISYIFIIYAVLRIPSADRCYQTYSTCASHLTVVLLYYGTSIFSYIKRSHSSSMTSKKVISLLTVVVTPVLTPFVYNLRNKKMKEAFKAVFCKSTKKV